MAATLHPRPLVVSLNPFSLEEVIADCEVVGAAVGLPEQGRAAAAGLRSRLDAAKTRVQQLGGRAKQGKVAFLEWTDPLFPGEALLFPGEPHSSPFLQGGIGPHSSSPSASTLCPSPSPPGGHWTPQLITLAGGTHPLNPPTL